MSDLIDDLSWRGLIALSTDLDALRAHLASGQRTLYCGFDPTAPSLHHGNLVQLITVRRFQDAGHRPLVLVGGATGLIGDPREESERTLNDKETVAGWTERIKEQVSRFVSFEGPNAAQVVNNLDWTAPMSAIDFLRDIGKHFRVGKMISKDLVRRRLDSDEGISYTEFSYQILQGMDYLELFRRYGTTLQTGGSDQWGNLIAGADLIHKVEHESVHVLATPLVTKADGTKFGKTAAGAIWLDPTLLSPYAFYQYWLNADDRDVSPWLRVFSLKSREEIEQLEKDTAERPAARLAQRALAEELTTLVHGADELRRVEAASRALFGRGELAELDEPTLRSSLVAAGGVTVGAPLPSVAVLLQRTGLVSSQSDARRTVREGGAYLNNRKLDDFEYVPTDADLLHGRYVVLRRGKRAVAGVERAAAGSEDAPLA